MPHAAPLLRRLALAAFLGCALLVLGCQSAFRDAMKRGDDLASVGQWDRAAAAYEEATRLDPDDDDARAALGLARRQQSAIRVARGYQLLRSGNARDALAPFVEAVKLDPRSLIARQGLEQAKAKVLSDAQSALAEGRLKQAYELSRTYLLVDPSHGEARSIEATARQLIAQAALERGKALESTGAHSLALVDHGEALQYDPQLEEARTRVVSLRRVLRDQVTYYVALRNFDGDASADDLGLDVDAAVLGAGLDPALPLRVVDQLPKGKSQQYQGLRLGGVFRGYAYERTSSRSSRSCGYICGKDMVTNPAYATAEVDMRTSRAALTSAEGRLTTARSALLPAERARDAAAASLAQKQAQASRAAQDLTRCRAQPGGQPGACGAEEQRKTRADEDERHAVDDARRAATAADGAKRELSDAESDVSLKRVDAQTKRHAFDRTSPRIEVDRHCTHSYAVDTVLATGEIECQLRGEGLYDTDARLNQAVTGRITRQDETFAAQAGVCAEVASGDPLTVPSPAEVRKLVVASAVAATQREILSAFDRYREQYLTRARAAAVDRRDAEAADGYVRYLFSLGWNDGAEKTQQAVSELARAKGVDARAVTIAIFGTQP